MRWLQSLILIFFVILWDSIFIQSTRSQAHYSQYDVYFKSKLANVLFTKALAKRLSGTNVTANSLHPGAVATELSRHFMFGRVSD